MLYTIDYHVEFGVEMERRESRAGLLDPDSAPTLSCGLRESSFNFLQSRNSFSVVNGSPVIEHLSMSVQTSTPTRATRMFKGL
uniref:Uncharacterized protein n=1 Tax=Callorhinchus milii TaxID=7868 RepID=A0A4W3I6Z4_CALMI